MITTGQTDGDCCAHQTVFFDMSIPLIYSWLVGIFQEPEFTYGTIAHVADFSPEKSDHSAYINAYILFTLSVTTMFHQLPL